VSTPADLDVLERVLRESGASQKAADASWSGYLVAVMEAAVAWLQARLPSLRGLRHLPETLGPAAVVAAIALVVIALVIAVRATLRARRRRDAPMHVFTRTIPAAAPTPARDRHGWRREIERGLAAGDLRAALEALWWWFARALTTARVDPAWTSRELLAHAGRRELGGLALALDRLLYGAARPQAADIRAFLSRAEEALP
jgi:hypothetical protein